MAQMPSPRPLGKGYLADKLGLYPVRSPRLSHGPGEIRKWRLLLLQAVKPLTKLRENRVGEAGAYLSGIKQLMFLVVVSKEQRPKAAANARIGEAADNKFL